MKRTFDDAALGDAFLGPRVASAYPVHPAQMFADASRIRAEGASNESVLAAYEAAHARSLADRYSAQSGLAAPTIAYARFLQESRVLGPRTMMSAERVLMNFLRTRDDPDQPDVLAALGDLYMNLRQRSMGIACYGQATTIRSCAAEIRERYKELQQRTGLGYSADAWDTVEDRIGRSGEPGHQPPLPPPVKLPSREPSQP